MKSKINKHTLKTKKTKKINITHKIFNFLQKGGLFGFFKSKSVDKPITIREINEYDKCDKMSDLSEYAKSAPLFDFLISNSDKLKLKSLHLKMNKSFEAHNKCSNKIYTDRYSKSKLSSTERNNKYIIKDGETTYRYVKVKTDNNNYSYFFKACEGNYKTSNKSTIYFLLYLMIYMKSFLNSCINLKAASEQLKGIKCIIKFFNNPEFVNIIFGNSSENKFSSQFDQGKNTDLLNIYTLFSGGNNNTRSNTKSTIDTLGDMKINFYFSDKENNDKYRRFITLLINKVNSAYEKIKTAYNK
jgi:hypothetical protein